MRKQKKLVWLVMLNVAYTVSFAQSKLDGLDIFKLNETDTTIVNKLVKEQRYKRITISSKKILRTYLHDTLYGRGLTIMDFIPDVANYPDDNPARAHYCPLVRTFQLSHFTINGVNCESVVLTFYKNKLVQLECLYGKEMVDVMVQKYGQPQIKMEYEEGRCAEKNKVYTRTWTNGGVECTMKITVNDNADCNFEPFRTMKLGLPEMEQTISQCDFEHQKMLEKEKN